VFVPAACAQSAYGYLLRHGIAKSVSLDGITVDVKTSALAVTNHRKLLKDYETVSRLLPDEIKALVQKLLTMKALSEKGARAEAHAIAAAVIEQNPNFASSIKILNDLIASTQNKLAVMAIECKERTDAQKEMRDTLGTDVARLSAALANVSPSFDSTIICS
jgi:hypothetical protein